jgi:hypothetical protein
LSFFISKKDKKTFNSFDMQINLKFLVLVVWTSVLSINAYGQEENYFKISGQYRVRAELRHGYRTLATDSSEIAFFTGQRARLMLDYKNDKIAFYASIQDSRTWGDEEQKKDNAGLQVNQLWAEIGLRNNLSLRLGRQELAYDDHRLLGNLDWGNLTISHDALLLKYSNEQSKFKWHIGGAFNQSGEPVFGTSYTLKNYKALGFTWAKKEFGKGHSLAGIFIVNGMNATVAASPKMKATYTVGPLYNYNSGGWKGVLGAYFQGGKTENNLAQSAFMANVYAEKKIKKIALGLGADYLSGNSDGTKATENHTFSTLYATNHKFYGYMDYFLAIPTDTKQGGLLDLYLRADCALSKTISTTLDVHHFSLANDYNLGTEFKKTLGTEADLLLDYKPSPLIHLQCGYAYLFATENMEHLKDGNANETNTWAYIMLKVSPTLFTHEFKK